MNIRRRLSGTTRVGGSESELVNLVADTVDLSELQLTGVPMLPKRSDTDLQSMPALDRAVRELSRRSAVLGSLMCSPALFQHL